MAQSRLFFEILRRKKQMPKCEKEFDKKYRCWISDVDKILSFFYVEGYELKEFDTYSEFQNYYYEKTYWGYKAQ